MAANTDTGTQEDAFVSGAMTGAATGATVGGPIGGAVGAIVGGILSVNSYSDQERAKQRAIQERNRALFRESVLKDINKNQVANLRSTNKNIGPTSGKGNSSSAETNTTTLPVGATPTIGSIGSGISSSGTF